MMQVAVMDEPIEVMRVAIVAEGRVVSTYSGYSSGTQFELDNGQIWQQTDATYSYQYAYMPEATVIDGIDGQRLHIDGMSESVRVRRIR